ncbi:MAG: PorP/SprF family type IX secretion system membrane protein [Bacteroidales bacterium]|nr:PorP/SprF family type IX secretion system membrane protein [Bacteroidales bacterium]
MDRNKLIGLIFVLLLVPCKELMSQDLHFTQFYAAPLYLNPAMAGTAVCPRLVANFRMQWPNITGKYTSYAASYDQYFKALSGGIGVLFVGDRAGQNTVVTNCFSLMYSFKADLTRKVTLRLGLQATLQQKSINLNNLTFGDMVDPRYGFVYATAENIGNYTKFVADFAAGVLVYSDKMYGGIAVHHFTQPKESFFNSDSKDDRLPMKITAHWGANFDVKKRMRSKQSFGDMSLSPNLIFQYQSKISGGYQYTTINYGMYFGCYPVIAGVWFRQGLKNADALMFLVGIEYKVFRVGYSYDVTLPSKKYMKPSTGGAHEVSVQYILPCPKTSRRVRSITCPKF